MVRAVHHPHCNRNCTPAGHVYDMSKRDHAHLAIMASRCGLCVEKLRLR